MTYYLWRYRIARCGRFGYHRSVWKVWRAWAKAEGGTAKFNAWNTTEPWPGATPYNNVGPSGHVWNYPRASAGTSATVATLRNGAYPRFEHYFARPAGLSPEELINQCAADFDRWGTGAHNVLAALRSL